MDKEAVLAGAQAFKAAMVTWSVIIIMAVIFTMFLIWFTNSLWGLFGLLLLGLLKFVSANFKLGD